LGPLYVGYGGREHATLRAHVINRDINLGMMSGFPSSIQYVFWSARTRLFITVLPLALPSIAIGS
jgi:hypothetical protein